MNSAQHSNKSSNWYTPAKYAGAACRAMDGIDLDPASCRVANELVGARRFFSLETQEDGLVLPWAGRVFLNPPSPARPWWNKLIEEHIERRCDQAVFLAYSIEQLSQSQGEKWAAPMQAFPHCIVGPGRVRFMCTVEDRLAALNARLAKVDREKPGAQVKLRLLERRIGELSGLAPNALIDGEQPTHASALIGVGVDHEAFATAFEMFGVCSRGSGWKRPKTRKAA